MSRWDRLVARFDWITRVDWLIGFGTAAVGAVSTGYAAAVWADWGPVGVFLATLVAGAAIGIAYMAWALFWHRLEAAGVGIVDATLAQKHEDRLQDKQDLRRIELAVATERRQLLAQARKFVARTVSSHPDDESRFRNAIEADIAFLNLRPHLSSEYLKKLRSDTWYVTVGGSSKIPLLARWYLDELDRLEQEWGLVPPSLGDRMVTLHDAASELYSALRGTDIGRQMEWKIGATPDEILNWAATYFVESAPIEVKRPPSHAWEPLSESTRRATTACDGARGLKYFDDDHATYIEPRLKRIDADEIIADCKRKARPL